MKTDTFSTILFGGLALLLLHGLTKQSCTGCGDGDGDTLGDIAGPTCRSTHCWTCRVIPGGPNGRGGRLQSGCFCEPSGRPGCQ